MIDSYLLLKLSDTTDNKARKAEMQVYKLQGEDKKERER